MSKFNLGGTISPSLYFFISIFKFTKILFYHTDSENLTIFLIEILFLFNNNHNIILLDFPSGKSNPCGVVCGMFSSSGILSPLRDSRMTEN